MRVDLAILSYNEAKNLPLVVEGLVNVRNRLAQTVELGVLVVNNGSADDTETIIAQLERQYSWLRHITIQVNQGYGYGVRQALSHLQGDVVGYMWGDNQFDPAILVPMIEEFLQKNDIQLVKTYRAKRYDGAYRLWVSKFYQLIFRVLYGVYTRDINSGPKLVRADFLRQLEPLRSNDWFIDAEIMIKATLRCTPDQVAEFPIVFHPRKFGKSNVKLTTCFQFLGNLIKYKFIRL